MSYDEATLNDLGDALQMNQPPSLEINLQLLSDEFDGECQRRHTMGEQKYGAGTWLGADTVQMAMDEVIDMANYIRFTWIKLRILRDQMQAVTDQTEVARALPGMEMLGKEAIIRRLG